MSQSAGTGSPIYFTCSACRKRRGAGRRGRDFNNITVGTAWRVTLTGRKRRKRPSAGCALGVRSSLFTYEYKCQVCDHVGWSNHHDLEHLANTAYGIKP